MMISGVAALRPLILGLGALIPGKSKNGRRYRKSQSGKQLDHYLCPTTNTASEPGNAAFGVSRHEKVTFTGRSSVWAR